MNKPIKLLLLLFLSSLAASSLSADLIVHYAFDEVAGGASTAVNSDTGTDMSALSNSWGDINGAGHLVISQSAGRNNPAMGSAAFSGNIYYRIDFDSWDTSSTKVTTQFGFRPKKASGGNTIFDFNLLTETATATGSLNTSVGGDFDYVQGGLSGTDGVSFIIGIDTDTGRDNGKILLDEIRIYNKTFLAEEDTPDYSFDFNENKACLIFQNASPYYTDTLQSSPDLSPDSLVDGNLHTG